MPTWPTTPATIEPRIFLEQWFVFETEPARGERHLLGMKQDAGYARISSPIKNFDRSTMRGVTSTGRCYQLVGPPGWTSDMSYLLLSWCEKHRVTQMTNVTAEYAPATASS
ncbi:MULTISPECIES: hypothetical protein [Caballeronia]|uniref:Uncharacterized protein n=1 Tax=Caballeronia jiangsuensis TaxID=1458357 RepID=A0ABW9CDN2_9BURK|nr:hypothetical protein [Caballeronia sp. GaOx3]